MKRILFALIILIFCVTAFSGCTPKEFSNLNKNDIRSIHVTSEPGGYEYSFADSDARAVIDYLSNLNLTLAFPFHSYTGMVWIISLEYESGEVVTVHYSCNKFIRMDNGLLYEMKFDEASCFEALLDELNG